MKHALVILLRRFALWLLRKTVTDSSLIRHFKSEIQLSGWTDDKGNIKDDMQQLACSNVMDLLVVLHTQGHSGFSYKYIMHLFNTVSEFKPLSALTGKDDEWNEVGDSWYQNKRYSAVFKRGVNGKAYWMDGCVFEDAEGVRFTNRYSKQYIDFPWYPESAKIISVTYDSEGNTIYPSDFVKADID